MQQAGIASLPYISTHGTGTPLGDPIESSALRKAMQGGTHSSTHCEDEAGPVFTMAAVKTLVGHTEGTAGLAGLLLAMSHLEQQTAAPLRYRSINPYVAASLDGWGSPYRLPIQAGPAAVGTHSNNRSGSMASQAATGTSSFAMSGVNAHAVVMHPDSIGHPQRRRSVMPPTWKRAWNFSAPVVPMTHPLLQLAVPQVGNAC